MPIGNIYRLDDELDPALYAMCARVGHECRMQDIRELDIEAWVREVRHA